MEEDANTQYHVRSYSVPSTTIKRVTRCPHYSPISEIYEKKEKSCSIKYLILGNSGIWDRENRKFWGKKGISWMLRLSDT